MTFETKSSSPDATSTVRPTELRAYLALPATQSRVARLVAAFVGAAAPREVKDEIAQQANLAALDAMSLPRSTKTMPGWLATVTRRAVYHHFRRSAADRRWLQPDEDVEEAPDVEGEPPGDPWLISDWLAPVVARDERDQETYEMIRYKARTGRTDLEVAEDHGLTYPAWTNRLSRFKKKYVTRWQRRRQLSLLLVLGGCAVVAATIAWIWWLARQAPVGPGPIRALPSERPMLAPVPSPSAPDPVTPRDTPFEPAAPPSPGPLRDVKPRPTP